MAIVLNDSIQGKNDVPSVVGSPVAMKSYATDDLPDPASLPAGTMVWDSDEGTIKRTLDNDLFDPREYGARGVDQEDVGTTGSIDISTSLIYDVADLSKFSVGNYVAISGADTDAEKLGAKILSIDEDNQTITIDTI